MDENIENGTNDFPAIDFNKNNGRKNIKNNVIFVDSFVFSAHEVENQQLSRSIFFSTNNYNIQITMFVPDDELIKRAVEESPKYFRIRTGSEDIEYNEENKEKGVPIWDYYREIEATEQFGIDLIEGNHPSKLVNAWFLETEEILNGLKIE
jgi:hypothetical protein